MQKSIAITALGILLTSLSALVFFRHEQLNLVLTYGTTELPTHKADEGCTWIKRTFSKKKISLFEQNCPTPAYASTWTYYEDADGRIMSLNSRDGRDFPTIQLFTKEKGADPLDVVKKEWYSKLTPEQQKACEIQNADRDSTLSEAPRKTAHKTRYEIDLKPEVSKEIVDKFQGLPSGREYDFLCGDVVGTYFYSAPPYFEFDDRSPDKYLFVRSFGNDGGPLIDLNSIQF